MPKPATPTPTPVFKPLLKVGDISRLLGVSKAYVYRMAELGLLPSVRWEMHGEGKKKARDFLRFTEEDALAFVKENRR